MKTEIAVRQGVLLPTTFAQAMEIAAVVCKSGMVPRCYEGNPGAVFVAMQLGAELGLSPMAALRSIAVINGRPTIWGDAALALVISHPDCESVEETLSEDRQSATCTVKRRGRKLISRTFTIADATRAGLLPAKHPSPWAAYEARMLQMRPRSWALRDSFPDVLTGLSTTEEARDTPAEAEWVEPTAPGRHMISDDAPAATAAPDATPPPATPTASVRTDGDGEPLEASPCAHLVVDEALAKIAAVRADTGEPARLVIAQVARLDSRNAVAKAATAKLQEIDAARAAKTAGCKPVED